MTSPAANNSMRLHFQQRKEKKMEHYLSYLSCLQKCNNNESSRRSITIYDAVIEIKNGFYQYRVKRKFPGGGEFSKCAFFFF